MIGARPRGDAGTEITIRDSGIGMDEDELKVAISPFGQVDSARNRWREGAGLGLPIAKALIELHGGTLDIKSAKGVGTEVAVFMPSVRENAKLEQQSLAGFRA